MQLVKWAFADSLLFQILFAIKHIKNMQRYHARFGHCFNNGPKKPILYILDRNDSSLKTKTSSYNILKLHRQQVYKALASFFLFVMYVGKVS